MVRVKIGSIWQCFAVVFVFVTTLFLTNYFFHPDDSTNFQMIDSNRAVASWKQTRKCVDEMDRPTKITNLFIFQLKAHQIRTLKGYRQISFFPNNIVLLGNCVKCCLIDSHTHNHSHTEYIYFRPCRRAKWRHMENGWTTECTKSTWIQWIVCLTEPNMSVSTHRTMIFDWISG